MSLEIASTTFLFDRFRSGRMKFAKGNREAPLLRWKFKLQSYPPKGVESTPAFDKDNNMYFGSHDNCFYSLDPEGNLRWMFKLGHKIYSSPLIIDYKIYFASGDGLLFCFNLNGNLLWVYNICDFFGNIKNPFARKFQLLRSLLKSYDYDRKKRWTMKCWSSPNTDSKGIIYITGYGLGLHAVRGHDGKRLWAFDLGSPRNHLSGVALNEFDEIFVASQRRNLYCLRSNGTIKWHVDTKLNYDLWGNPSVDTENQTVYFPLGCRESKGKILALDYKGNLKWKMDIQGAVRGSVAISYNEYVVVCSLSGKLYLLNKKNGTVLKSIILSNAERALWTTPSIDKKGNIFVTTKDNRYSGTLYCFDDNAKIIWRYQIGKALSTPVIDQYGRLYVGSWKGEFYCIET